MVHRRNILCSAALAAALCALAPAASASDYPDPARPIRIVVGFAAGGGLDVLARTISRRLGEELGGTVVVENRPGAGGSVAAEQVAKAPPDGYLLHIASGGPYTISPSLRAGSYDPAKEMKGVSLLATMPLLLVTGAASEFKSVPELLAKARAQPLSYGSGGSGTLSHIAHEYFRQQGALQGVHVPYKGSAPAAIELASGLVSYSLLDPSIKPLITGNKLKLLAVTTPRRSAQFPGVPTISEAGLPGYEVTNWYGLAVATGVPADIVAKINKALVKIMAEPEIVKTLALSGIDATSSTPAQMNELIAQERARWVDVIRKGKITAD